MFSNAVSDFTCNPQQAPRSLSMRRLSKRQLTNTVKSLIRGLTNEQVTEGVSAAFSTPFPDDTGDVYKRNDNTLESAHLSAYFEMAKGLATYLTGDSARLSEFVKAYIDLDPGTCSWSVASPTAQCVNLFIKNFGLRVFRRPLSTTEISKFVNEYNLGSAVKDKFAGAIFRALLAPQFLFTVEDQGVGGGKELKLTPYEVASRLSYHFWNDMPSEELFALAKNSDLWDSSFENTVNNMMVDQRTQKTFEEFFSGWLRLQNVPNFFETDRSEFVHQAKGVTYNEALRTEMINEMRQLTNYVTWNANGGSYKDLFTTDISFTSNASLMRVYGVNRAAVYPITNANVVRMPAGERSGVLTRAAMVISGSAFENPVKRGIHILDDFLCIAPEPPDSSDLPEGSLNPPVLDVNMTTRERYTVKTSNQQCKGCHSRINPVGFALTNYSALGQFRQQEPIFDEGGEYIHDLPVNSEVDLSAIVGQNGRSSSANEFSSKLATSLHGQKCISRKYYEFVYGQPSDDKVDGCALAKLRKSLGNDGSQDIKQFFKSVALEPSFVSRNLEE